MRLERLIPKVIIIAIVVLMSIYSLKFFSLVFSSLGIVFPITLDREWWKPPRNLFIYASLLLFFLLTFLFRRTANLKTKSILFAFFVSLLVEMYGFSFSLYILYVILGHSKILDLYVRHPCPSTFLPHVIRFPVLVISWSLGIFLIMKGWARIWNSRDTLVKDGIYAYSRHPQYLGLIIILGGNLFFFPTPFLFCLFLILSAMYYRLARKEERELELKFGEKYIEYKNMVPMWIS